MSQNFNIFEHHHGPEGGHEHGPDCNHDHDHDHDEASQADLDPAQQAAADALKFSFRALQLFMVLVAVFYVASGWYKVSPQEVAIELRMGAVQYHADAEKGQTPVYRSGSHYNPPYPIGQVIKVPVAPQTLSLNKEFWWEVPENSPEDGGKNGPLVPDKDGSLLTADANIVHMRWDVTFSVSDPVAFVKRVAKPSSDVRVMTQAADAIVRAASEDGVVYAVAQTTADDIIRGIKTGGEQGGSIVSTVTTAKARAQQILDAVGAGLTINAMTVRRREMPFPVREAYAAVINAENERGNLIDRAKRDASAMLGETAGTAFEPMSALISQYQDALVRSEVNKDAEAARQASKLEADINTAFDELKIKGKDGVSVDITGKAAATIFDAINYRTSLVAQVEAEANTFNGYYQVFKDNPALRRVVMSQLWLDTKETILTGDVETLYLPKGQTYLELNRDPAIARKREMQRLKMQDSEQPAQ